MIPPDRWLQRTTGKTPIEWLGSIQRAIKGASYRPKWNRRHALQTLTLKEQRLPKRRREALVIERLAILKRHDETNVEKWLTRVARDVHRNAPKSGLYDGNMRAALVMGYVLLYWVVRCQRAKAYDPRRPVKLRRKAMERWINMAAAVSVMFTDERQDANIFPGQKWDPPFSPFAVNGDFI